MKLTVSVFFLLCLSVPPIVQAGAGQTYGTHGRVTFVGRVVEGGCHLNSQATDVLLVCPSGTQHSTLPLLAELAAKRQDVKNIEYYWINRKKNQAVVTIKYN
ncbi:hypothetical protein ACW5XW_20420 [Aeromonas piscicola]|uniref:hypothetical protein n=1 Tax=Aeromonas piscicola TaxID=600645 RepID=UPI0005B50277|nr:hypothetical protein [Aeromonas piscicola]